MTSIHRQSIQPLQLQQRYRQSITTNYDYPPKYIRNHVVIDNTTHGLSDYTYVDPPPITHRDAIVYSEPWINSPYSAYTADSLPLDKFDDLSDFKILRSRILIRKSTKGFCGILNPCGVLDNNRLLGCFNYRGLCDRETIKYIYEDTNEEYIAPLQKLKKPNSRRGCGCI